ncbi:exonuclease SbcC [Gemelliphila palaticanis]|uniref:Exonuclease SbcC n=1 Tax=Gemelliphila palaticanis TaxID=81950 RepID=A0ABX2T025_9BACL|nr:exonuclease SbcC [Gemella palaticanis]MBF0714794.1 exonuclease SbcC [Gemella palaticanis]NYS46724.1 exonuclease SbcC [Gemella palaticanis]
MNFKYHNGYKGYYLQENNKYVRPFKKLDEEETKFKLKDKEIELNFDKNLVIEIPSECVVFENKNEVYSTNNKSKLDSINKLSYDNKYKNFSYVPSEITNNFIKFVKLNEGDDSKVFSILEILENVFYSDYSFRNKAKKLFYYSDQDIKQFLNNYLPLKNVNQELKVNIIKNYPSQYIYEHLPLDYKEVEMVYVFYFIILVELLSILK